MPLEITAAADISGGLVMHLVTSSAEFASLKPAWLGLEAQSADPCFFQCYAWCGHVAEVLERTFASDYMAIITVAYRDGVPVALLPLSRQKRTGIWQLRTLDDPFGQIAGMVYRNRGDAEALVAKTLDLLRERKLVDVVHIDRVLAGSPLEVVLRQRGASVRGEVGSPVIDTAGFADISALKSSRNKKTMKNLRNSINRLTKAGDHAHTAALGGKSVAPIVAATLRRRTAWMEARGITAPQFRSPAHDAILVGGEAWGLDAIRAGFELQSNGQPIAHQWGFVHQGRYYAYMSATDPTAALLSPGRLHLAFVIEDAMRQGVRAVEMLTPASDYKMVWTDTARTLHDVVLPLSFKGRMQDLIWGRFVRPMMKGLFYALPSGLRRRIKISDAHAASSDAHAGGD